MNPLSWIGKLGEAVTWYKAFSLAIGEGLYATFALAALAAVIVIGWRAPKLPWLTGRLALALFLALVIGAGAGFLAVVYNREIKPRIGHGTLPQPQVHRDVRVPAAGHARPDAGGSPGEPSNGF